MIWAEYVIDVAEACRREGALHRHGHQRLHHRGGSGRPGSAHRRVASRPQGSQRTRRTSKLCHVHSVEPVLAAAERARHHWDMHVEVVTNVVPGVNDSTGGAAVHRDVDRRGHRSGHTLAHHAVLPVPGVRRPRTRRRSRRSERLVPSARRRGLSFVYLGNIAEPGGEDTVCPQCGAVVVRRTGYTITARHTRDGACSRCGADLNIVE